MIIHMFGFHWVGDVSQETIQRITVAIKNLQGSIPGLTEVWVGENFSTNAAAFDFGGVLKFSSREALDAYHDHDAHRALLSWLVPLVTGVEIDFAPA